MSTGRRPADIARRSAKALQARPRDAFRRETFALPREQAREKAREMFRRFPKAAYMTEIESWRELPRLWPLGLVVAANLARLRASTSVGLSI